ncbi:MAG TPA: glucose 1-dehydrogenase [Vicinamibacterales bacterium]|jgi:NAD(P)-dependent dehydrogenase (short-subunit alcohol dehydrogenase family)|nr:glucose 1-dehydrogenase [Vicinamibacterales bacterium]
MSFQAKTVIVTGATSGIGREAARAFAAEGASVLMTGRDERALTAAAAGLPADGRVRTLAVDLTSDGAPGQLVQAAVDAFGGLDVLVNAAGILASGTIENTTDAAWDEMMAINLRAPFRLMRAAAPHLAARRGAVVNVSSVNGLRSFPNVLAYCVSKAAVDQLTRCAALELAASGVRVNAVNPGVTVTNLHRRSGMDEEKYAAFLERSKTTHPLGRPGHPEDIAGLILFLASERAGWMTGETIPVDGGRHLTCAR